MLHDKVATTSITIVTLQQHSSTKLCWLLRSLLTQLNDRYGSTTRKLPTNTNKFSHLPEEVAKIQRIIGQN